MVCPLTQKPSWLTRYCFQSLPFLITTLRADCGQFRSEEISQLDLLPRLHPVMVYHSGTHWAQESNPVFHIYIYTQYIYVWKTGLSTEGGATVYCIFYCLFLQQNWRYFAPPDESERCCNLGCSGLCQNETNSWSPAAACQQSLLKPNAHILHIWMDEKVSWSNVPKPGASHFRSKSPFWCFTHVTSEQTPPRDLIVNTTRLVYVFKRHVWFKVVRIVITDGV